MPGIPRLEPKLGSFLAQYPKLSRTWGFAGKLLGAWPESCSPRHLEQLKEDAGPHEAGPFELHSRQKTDEDGEGMAAFLTCPVLVGC